MNVLSLFDGISCGQVALERAGIKVDNYFASEINKNAIKVTQYHYPNTIQLGDVAEWHEWNLPKIDLLIGGSPCQDFSSARAMGTFGEQPQGLKGKKSSLFYIYLDVLNYLKDNQSNELNWLLENVRMSKIAKKELDEFLGVSGVYINSELVSFQKRARYYWSNLSFDPPSDQKISFQDFIETNHENLKRYKLNKTKSRIRMWSDGRGKNTSKSCANITYSDKIYCITTKQDRCPNSGLIEFEDFCRFLTRRELELGQTLPIGYTDQISYNQAQEVIGNCWTVDVIAHIFKSLNEENLKAKKQENEDSK